MKRLILTPSVLPASALAEVKQWLGITINNDDAELLSLLLSSLTVCEAFIGELPLEAQCEERLDAQHGWLKLSTRPVQAITSVEQISHDGTRQILPSTAWDIDLSADGTGHVWLTHLPPRTSIAVGFTAGHHAEWDTLPDALRHGIIRLAAHQYRERESKNASPLPPASVAALWRPWRTMRLV